MSEVPISQERLEGLIQDWSKEAQEAKEQGNMAFSLGMSCCADELREVLENNE